MSASARSSVFGSAPASTGDIGGACEAGGRIIGQESHRNCRAAQSGELGDEPVPWPGVSTGAGNEQEGAHGYSARVAQR